MGRQIRDRSLDALLDLDGLVFVVDPDGRHWVKFSVQRVDPTSERPHGLSYSLTLHTESGERLVGFDNAQPASRGCDTTINIAFGPSGHTITKTPLSCWRTSGPKWTPCLNNEESFHDDAQGRNCRL